MFKAAVSRFFPLFLALLTGASLLRALWPGLPGATGGLFSFSVQSAFLCLLCLLLFPIKRLRRSAFFAFLAASALICALLAAALYLFVLHPIGRNWGSAAYALWATCLHVLCPLLYTCFWLAYMPHGRLASVPKFLLPLLPFAYYALNLVRSLRGLPSPYPFLEVRTGLLPFLLSSLLLLAFLLLFCGFALGFDFLLRPGLKARLKARLQQKQP